MGAGLQCCNQLTGTILPVQTLTCNTFTIPCPLSTGRCAAFPRPIQHPRHTACDERYVCMSIHHVHHSALHCCVALQSTCGMRSCHSMVLTPAAGWACSGCHPLLQSRRWSSGAPSSMCHNLSHHTAPRCVVFTGNRPFMTVLTATSQPVLRRPPIVPHPNAWVLPPVVTASTN